ncbi:hypothetical protein [Pseudoduganella aquatica]|uniref:Uncharacterized protein n=1 Tax=Pseudoduganella aquatica TaxID=2660641 RepID=A0A7X4HAY8_9BURK|nr:hypothetical protein [Pseudoduganella aquatica]MYN07911.1 hypothetical protein [Pseudoduganella aquatica]
MRRKHLFYLSSDRLDAWLWQSGKLSGPASFAATRAGLDAFLGYLEHKHPGAPALLLADLVEEDFQRMLLPHVGGKAGRNLLERRLLQQYRETPYRQAMAQGRAEEGRRDDILLCSALTNPLLLQPWTDALALLKVPLAGLYSVPLLSEELVSRLGLGREHEHLLLVTQQTAGVRQSYFHDGRLKFSRLTLATDREGALVNAGAETARTQQFLVSVRLIERGEQLHAVMVAPEPDLERWSAQCESGPETAYHFIPLAIAAGLAGLGGAGNLGQPSTDAPLADPLFLELLARTQPAGQYPLGEDSRYYRLWRIRQTLMSSSAALAACALLWTGGNLWAYADAQHEGSRLVMEAAGYDASYRVSMSDMPPSLAPTANMKAAVTIERLLATQAPAPIDMVGMLSAALDKVPQVQIVRLDWRVAADGADPEAAIPSSVLGIPSKPPQSLRVEAEIPLVASSTRAIVDSMNAFAQELARNPRLTVAIERPVLDVSSSAKLSGSTGAAGGKPAPFILNLSLAP